MALIHEAMAKIMKDLDFIGKTRTNSGQGFKFRGIEDIYNAMNPLLSQNGVVTLPNVVSVESSFQTTSKGSQMEYVKIQVEYTFMASDGSSVMCKTCGSASDSGDKAIGKAMSYAHKYAMVQTFCIPTEDVKDGDEDTHTFVRDQEKKPDYTPKPMALYTGAAEQISILRDAFAYHVITDIEAQRRIAQKLWQKPMNQMTNIIEEEKKCITK